MAKPNNPPMLNLPDALKVLVGVMVVLHLPHYVGLDSLANTIFQYLAFVPLRYIEPIYWWDDPIATLISPLGYTLVHADWVHLLVNLGMLIAFGKAVMDVAGLRVFVVLYAVGGLAGALIVVFSAEMVRYPLVGASAAISGLVGAMILWGIVQQRQMPRPFHTRRRSVQFFAVWVGLNVMMAILPHAAFASNFRIAWSAHLAGLLAGIIYAWWGLKKIRLNNE